MKILVISDLHGRDELLRKAAVLHTDRDGILFLGDGARDIDVDALTVGGRFFAGVRGNCDPVYLATQNYDFDTELFINLGEYNVIMMHGHTHGVKHGIERAVAYASERGADILLYGHTHQPVDSYYPEGTAVGDAVLKKPLWVMNPGALCEGSYGLLQIKNKNVLISHGKVK